MQKSKLEQLLEKGISGKVHKIPGEVPAEKKYNILYLGNSDQMSENPADMTTAYLTKLGYSGSRMIETTHPYVAYDVLATGEVDLFIYEFRSEWSGELDVREVDSTIQWLAEFKIPQPLIFTYHRLERKGADFMKEKFPLK